MKIQSNLINNFSYVKSDSSEKILKKEDKSISDEFKSKEDEKAEAERLKKEALAAVAEEMRKLTEEANKQVEDKGKEARRFGAILEIFRRIAKGDKVSPKDESALMEYDMKLYLTAKNAARLADNKKRKKYKKSLIAELEEMYKKRKSDKAGKEENDNSSEKVQGNNKTEKTNNSKIGEQVGGSVDVSI